MKVQDFVRSNFAYGILIVGMVVTMTVLVFHARSYIDSDMASEIILANLLNQEGSFVSTNWWYSTELRAFSTQWFYRLGLWLLPQNWYGARMIGQSLMWVILIGLYMGTCHLLGFRKHGVTTAIVLALPFGTWYFWYGPFGGYYFPLMILIMASFAMIILYMQSKQKMVQTISIVVLTIVSLMNGLNGFKALMGFYIPLVITTIILWFYHWYSNLGRIPHQTTILLVLSLYALAVCGFGYLINHEILADVYSFYSYDGQYWSTLDLNHLLSQWSFFLSLFGYPRDALMGGSVKLLSFEGVLGAFGLISAGWIMIALIWTIRKVKTFDGLDQMIPVLLFTILVVQGVIFAFTSGTSAPNGSYWLIAIPFALLVLQLYFEKATFRLSMVKPMIIAVFWVSIGATSISTVRNFFENGMRINPELEPVSEFLVANGYTKGYAAFWNGNVLTEWSNGSIEVWVTNDFNTLHSYQWLQKQSHCYPPQGEIFVLTSKSELKENNLELLMSLSDVVYPFNDDESDHNYVVMIYDDIVELQLLIDQIHQQLMV